MIKHNTYFNGAVQSLAFSDGNQRCTVGVVTPGNYDFGKAEHTETIEVLTGYLTINGQCYEPGEHYEVAVGEQIQIGTSDREASYLCRYGE